MKINRSNKYLIIVAMTILLSFLTSCTVYKYIDKSYIYDAEYIIGKTSDEIQDKYGILKRISKKCLMKKEKRI